jgi:hypothetical protein
LILFCSRKESSKKFIALWDGTFENWLLTFFSAEKPELKQCILIVIEETKIKKRSLHM